MGRVEKPKTDDTWGIFKRAFKRIGINALALFAGLLAIKVTRSTGYYPMQSGWFSVLFTIWVSVVCLCPGARRGIKDPDWFVPVGAGLLGTAAAVITGLPWQPALLFGGAQTWLQRLFALKREMLWDWVGLPFLLAALLMWTDVFYYGASLLTFPLVALTGVLCHRFACSLSKRQENRQNLERLLVSFEKLSSSALLSDTVKTGLNSLLQNLRRYISLDRKAVHKQKLLLSLDNLENKLEDLEKVMVGGPLPEGSDFLQKGLQKTDKLMDLATESVICDLNDFNNSLKAEIKKLDRENPKPKDELSLYEDKAEALGDSLPKLPSFLAMNLERIITAVHEMVGQMRNDPQDKLAAEGFLRRYLKHVEEIVNQSLKFNDSQDEGAAEVLKRASEVLSRLARAFEDENRYLRQNDHLNFTAELNALDEFLRMRGH